MDIQRLQPFVGEWSVEASLAPGEKGETVFEWVLGGRYLLQRATTPHPEAPDGLCVIGSDEDGDAYIQHYFDSRGVTRIYAMTFARGEWVLLRNQPDFSPLDFSQRFVGMFTEDGNTISGRWEIAREGGDWEPDFDLTYTRRL
jgi:hypothetical protein